MAFDQNSIPKDLRPLNIVRTVPEDLGIAPVTTSGRPVEVFYGNPTRDVGRSPGTIPGFYYPTTVTDAGFVGQGFTNAGPVAAGWVPQVGPSQPLGVVSVGPIGVMNSGAGSSQNLHSGARVGSNPSDQASDDGGDNSVSGRKVKFLCSFGGRIIPRPSDGALRYVGGQTRIISLRRDVSFAELVRKMVDTYGQDVAIKYQLPDEDLDALVSVSSPEDLENMMDEYEKLVERVSDGSAKLRVFLFSASDLESSGVVQLGYLQDSGQRYVEAVNGTNDGVSGIRLTRKASIASAGSTQNSEFSGSEAVDSLGHGQGELRSVLSFDALSPSGTSSATSQEPAYRLVSTDANPATHADASVAPMTNPLVVPGPVPSLSAQPEHGLEKTVPVTGQQRQMGYDMQQTGTTYPGTTPYVPAYVDLQRETLNRADYVQIPSQMGFPRQLLGTVGPVINQQHIIAGAPNQQFLPALHMTMTPSGHVSMNPNLGPSLIQPQPVRLEHYPAEGTLGQRVVRFPVDQGYGAYQHHAPPALGGAYAWHQIPHTQQVPLSEGQVPQPLVTGSEASPRFDDCLMCQKSLPHAHSDTIAEEQRESPASTVSDFNPVYHSLRLDERGQPIYRAITTGTLGEVDVEQKGASVGQRIRGQMDHGVGKGQGEVIRVSQTVDKQYECDRNLQKPEVAEHPKVSVPQGMIGLTGTMQSPYGVFVGAVPQPCHVNVTEQLLVPSQYQVKQEVAANKPVNSDCLKVGGMPGQTPDNFSGESPKNYGGAAPMMLPKENDIESVTAYNHLRQIEGRMENLLMHPTEIIANNEQSKPAVDNFRREDILNNRVQQFGGREGYLGLVTSNVNPNEMPVSSNETPFLHNIQAAEGYEFSQHPVVTNPGVHVQSNYGVNHLIPDEISPHLTVLPAHATERTPAIGEWKDGAQHFQPMLSPTTAEMALHDGTAPSEQDNSNSLYSNQDPWNLQHDTHFPPPKPSKLQLKREAAGTKDYSGENCFGNSSELPTVTNGGLQTQIRLEDGTYLPSGNTDFNSDQLRSKKGSEEEMIKQELQAVAEGVAASVLQSSTPSNADLSIHGRSESPSSSQWNAEFESTNARKEEPKDKFEETITKFPERANLGFPVSDGIGRLQIIKNGDLEEIRELGSGTFGTVYHGKWRGSDVAIKRINDRCFAGKASEQERMRDDFWNEAIKLADLHHPNVVAFYGVVLDGPGGSVATVTEYMVNGSLRNALQKNERNLDKRKRLVIAMDVAFGMEYLHGKNIVHFDLKSDNLLVNLRDPHRPICKVGDLGLSKVKCQTLISGGVRGTLPWMAPELLNGSSSLVSEKVDVFSYGIVMWELLTREEPYAELHYGAIIGGIVSNTLRPPVPVSCDPDWRSLMERCWSAEPSERPNFTEIANELRVMQSKIPPKGQNQQSPSSANTTQAKS